jgi:predicted aspartyl protease
MRPLCLLLVAAACGTRVVPAPPPDRTTVAAEAQPLLDAWATAIGGRDRLAAIQIVHQLGRLESQGLSGRYQSWVTASGERREQAELDGVERWITVVAQSGEAWHADRNGKVRPLDGVELADERSRAYLGAFAALLTDRLEGRVSRESPVSVRIEPAGGEPISVTFDQETHLPVTLSYRSGSSIVVIGLADWREVEGVRFPFRQVTQQGADDNRFAILLERVDVHGAPPAGTFARPADPPPDYRFVGGSVTVPFRYLSSLIIADVSVNGSPPLAFIVDTGAGITVVNRSRVERLGLTPIGDLEASAGGGDVAMSYVKDVSFGIGGLTLERQTIATILLDPIEGAVGMPIDGILGYDFFSRFVVRLDFVAHTMTVFDPAGPPPPPAGVAVPIIFSTASPHVKARLEVPGSGPLEGLFLVDTGCTCELSFNAPYTDAHRLIAAQPRVVTPPKGASRGAGGETKDVIGRIDKLVLGGTELPSLVASFSTEATGSDANPDYAGLIGSRLLRRFVVTFDYNGKRMWLEKSPRFDDPSRLVRAGIVWRSEGARLFVHRLYPDYPGAKAGLAEGDELVSFDGSKTVDREVVEELLTVPGTRRLVVRRAGKERTFSITPLALL